MCMSFIHVCKGKINNKKRAWQELKAFFLFKCSGFWKNE